ncbi:hypothetical protein EG329_008257 [Mollisiaceae sp. DMI_Dod_QoI]|nr:hypothetical protein EG329_008257 [Helotiales sp. DMI_Dod_QoI]
MRLDDDWHRNWLKDVNPRNEDRMKKIREGNFTENVNWLTVYKQLVVLKKGVLGVRNRARVWYLVEEVVKRFADLRQRLVKQSADLSTLNLVEDEDFPVEPTVHEVEVGLIKREDAK